MKIRNLLLIGFALMSAALALFLPAVPQPLAYHDFADQHAAHGIANFDDVVSNLAFALAGLAYVAIWTNSLSMTVDFGSEADRPMYIGLSQTLTAPATILAPILGGWIADLAGFQLTFMISAALSVALCGVLIMLVEDPRKGVVITPSSQELVE